jgi:diguanylate cyclase (GGDEF)-like protein/PAS domain S-box-containing protein
MPPPSLKPAVSLGPFALGPAVVLLILLMIPVLVWLTGAELPVVIPPEHMVAFHTSVEMFAVVVAILVFAVGYHVLDEHRACASLMLACAFLAVGLLDFLHLMAYPGMPDLVTPNTSHKTLIFWLAARLVAAVAILLYVILPASSHEERVHRRLFLVSALALVALVAFVGIWRPLWVPALFRPGEGLTSLKVSLEALVIALHVLTLGIMALRPQIRRRSGMGLLAGALVLIVASELYFMIYRDLTDTLFVLGHVYKVLAYLLIYRGMFLESVHRPLKRLEAARKVIEVRERRYRQLVDTAPDGVLVTDAQGRIVLANRNMETLFGYRADELVGRPVESLMPERFRTRHEGHRGALVERWRPRAMGGVKDLIGLRRDGTEFPLDISLNSFEDDAGKRITAFIRDITERRQHEAHIQHQATHDSLTGLPNRWLLRDRLAQALAQAQRHGTKVAVMLLDLDNFKLINDSLGHLEGDAVLREVAGRLKTVLRREDTVARFGGDEFMVLLTDVRRETDLASVAGNILKTFSQPIQTREGHTLNTSTSIGIALYPQDGADEETLVRYADMAMYEAKQSGRNTYAFFSQRLDRTVYEEQRLQERLKLALAEEGFQLHYQPLVDVGSSEVVGVEALLRWHDEELGQVSPERFVPVAEANGLIVPLGDWVLRAACKQAARFAAQGLALRVSVNLSAVQFRQQDLVDKLRAALEASGAPPGCVDVEVTETVAMADVELARQQLEGLKALGVGVSLDDFGTGYSSLAYLKALPIDRLKIDRSFVQDIGSGHQADMILRAIVSLGHSLDLRLVAEGVETESQLRFLSDLGCHTYQGWLHSRAMPANDLAAYIDTASGSSSAARHIR